MHDGSYLNTHDGCILNMHDGCILKRGLVIIKAMQSAFVTARGSCALVLNIGHWQSTYINEISFSTIPNFRMESPLFVIRVLQFIRGHNVLTQKGKKAAKRIIFYIEICTASCGLM
jgi:hypothetical protein